MSKLEATQRKKIFGKAQFVISVFQYQHFLLFPQCFHKFLYFGVLKTHGKCLAVNPFDTIILTMADKLILRLQRMHGLSLDPMNSKTFEDENKMRLFNTNAPKHPSFEKHDPDI